MGIIKAGTHGSRPAVQKTVRDWQEKIFFEKTLTASSVSNASSLCQLSLPAWFVQEHGDKIHKSVTLQSAAQRRMWTVGVRVHFPHERPQVVFYGGWKAFVVSNRLVKGDRLTFTLTTMSTFEVFILRSGGNPKLGPKMWSKDSSFPRRKSKKRPLASLPDQFVHLSHGTGSEKPEIEFNGWFVKKRTEEKPEEIIVADSASNPTEYSPPPCSSDMDSHFFEPQDDDEHDQSQNSPPCYLKRVTANRMEIPCRFMKTHFSGIETRMELQGIHEGSPVQNVDCTFYIDKGRPRLFFTTGWTDFMNDNFLRIGQRLAFTLNSKCFFVVRNA